MSADLLRSRTEEYVAVGGRQHRRVDAQRIGAIPRLHEGVVSQCKSDGCARRRCSSS